jgi:hypothetical protein
MIRFGPNSDTSEEFQRGFSVGPLRDSAIDFGSQTKGKGPEMVSRKRVAMTSVDQHGSGSIGKVLDPTFGNAILMMGVDSAESHGLTSGVDCSAELFGGEDAIVAVVVFDGHIVLLGEPFKGLFGSKRVFC